MAVTIGTHLGAYEVTALLGRGGMGEVYQARDRQLQRDVALKLLPEVFASDPDRLARFQREAQVLASLNHPNIAQIYGLEKSGGMTALVMELVEGPTLADRIAQGAIPLDEALPIAKQMAEALEAAHEKGVIHRDLKPANVKVRPDGTVKVLDFGLAKAVGPPEGGHHVQDGRSVRLQADLTDAPTITTPAMMTGVGVILGTAAYMSPEQARGKVVDKRADIWAFGCVVFEMLTGARPFDGEDMTEVLGAVVRLEPQWDALPSDVPPLVRTLLHSCLIKDPRRRVADISTALFVMDKAASLAPLPIAEPTTSSAPRGRLAWMAFAAAAVFMAVALAIPALQHLRETPPEMPMIRSTVLAPEKTTLDFTNGLGLPALSPDGRRIVFGARTGDGKTPLWVRSLDALTAQALAGTEGATFPFWSPDSRFIAFFADGKLKKIDAAGGPALTLADARSGRGGSWSRDGVIVFAPGNTGLLRVSSAGGASSPVSKEQGSVPSFLPDGQHFLFQDQSVENTAEWPIRVGSLDGAQSKVVGQGSNARYAQGHLLFLREGTLMAQPFDTDRLVTTGEAIPIAERVQTVLISGRVGVFSASDAGSLIYRQGAGSRRQLTWFDRTGKTVGTVGEPDDDLDGYPELSPDERRVVIDRNVQRNPDVWLIDLLRGGTTRFTFDAATDRRALWSLDGAQIVFGSDRKTNSNGNDLYTKSSSGAGAEQLLLESPNLKIPYGWSADGRFLLYLENDPKTGADVWALPVQGDRKPVAIANSPFNELNGQFSTDGRWVAYQSNESGRYEIYVVPFPAGSGRWQISTTDGGVAPRWRHDGKELFFVASDGQMMAASVSASGIAFEAAPPVALFQTRIVGSGTGEFKHQYAVSADGRFLITVPADDSSAASITLLQNWKPSAQGN